LPKLENITTGILDHLLDTAATLEIMKDIKIRGGYIFDKTIPEIKIEHYNPIFTNTIYIYVEGRFDNKISTYLCEGAIKKGLIITIRDIDHLDTRVKLEKPIAFISHDSRDKSIVREITDRLQSQFCTVWFDEYSLRVGDSLRESIEKGLKECKRCILFLSPNYINNSGWTKHEFDTIFTRELIEKNKLILPIWHNISDKQVYDYCPILKDRVATNTSKGLDYVTNDLLKVLRAYMPI
jgi:hypothetical protein